MKDRWMNVGHEEEELKPYAEPEPDFNDTKRIGNHTIALISHVSKVMLKILQATLQQYMNCELPDVQAGF